MRGGIERQADEALVEARGLDPLQVAGGFHRGDVPQRADAAIHADHQHDVDRTGVALDAAIQPGVLEVQRRRPAAGVAFLDEEHLQRTSQAHAPRQCRALARTHQDQLARLRTKPGARARVADQAVCRPRRRLGALETCYVAAMEFSQLGLIPALETAVASEGYTTPTPIQARAIPFVLAGRDLLGLAQTGTGKTAAFALPVLQRLAGHAAGRPQPGRGRPIRCLVLTPTRELAAQIQDSFATYGKHLPLTSFVIFGGVGMEAQKQALRTGMDVLVATPGRLLDLAGQGLLELRQLEVFVLDEADRMLDMGFIHDVRKVIRLLPQKRQTLFFSATMPREAQELADQLLKNPETVAVVPPSTTAERVDQEVYFVEKGDKRALLVDVLRDGAMRRVLVFSRTKHGANRIAEHLTKAGVYAEAIHGNKSQNARERALSGFKTGRLRVLVATDIAARGIDVTGVSHVFNFELPNVPEQYVHRIGRTARAGADGVALSFCAPDEKAYLKDIERLTGVKLMPQPLPEDFQKEAARLPLPTRKPAEAEQDARREERDARGRGGARGGGRSGGGQRGNGNRSPGGQGRNGQPRDTWLRNDRQGSAPARGPVFNPLATEGRGAVEDRPRRDERPAPRGDRAQQPRAFGELPRRDSHPRAERPSGEHRGDRRDQPRGDRRPGGGQGGAHGPRGNAQGGRTPHRGRG